MSKPIPNTVWKVSVSGVILVLIFRIRTEYEELQSTSLYSVQIRENADQNKSEQKHFLCSAKVAFIRSGGG